MTARRAIPMLLAAATLAGAPATAQVAGGGETDAAVKTAVRAAWEAYLVAFSDGRTDVVAEQVYAAPSYQLGAAGASVRMTPGDTKARFDATLATLAEERYDRSETRQAAVCVLNTGAALLTTHFVRYRTDDTVLLEGASSYLFGKFDDGWRIVAIIANPAGKLVTCD